MEVFGMFQCPNDVAEGVDLDLGCPLDIVGEAQLVVCGAVDSSIGVARTPGAACSLWEQGQTLSVS